MPASLPSLSLKRSMTGSHLIETLLFGSAVSVEELEILLRDTGSKRSAVAFSPSVVVDIDIGSYRRQSG
jgi:hypothetical protein